MNITQTVTSFVKTGKQSFEMTLAMGDEEYIPKLMAEVGGKFHLIGIASPDILESLIDACRVALEKGHVTTLILTSDTFGIKEAAWGDPKYAPGTLRQHFEAGDPNVGEALVVEVVTLDEAVQVTIPYVRKGNRIQWRKQYTRSGYQHETMAIMQAALAMSAEQAHSQN